MPVSSSSVSSLSPRTARLALVATAVVLAGAGAWWAWSGIAGAAAAVAASGTWWLVGVHRRASRHRCAQLAARAALAKGDAAHAAARGDLGRLGCAGVGERDDDITGPGTGTRPAIPESAGAPGARAW